MIHQVDLDLMTDVEHNMNIMLRYSWTMLIIEEISYVYRVQQMLHG